MPKLIYDQVIKPLGRLLAAVLIVATAFIQTAHAAAEFEQVRDAQPNTDIVSSTITLDNIKSATQIRIENGEMSINGGEFSAQPAQVKKGDRLRVKLESAAEEKAAATAKIYLAERVIPFTVINAGRPFGINFNEQLGVLSDAVVDINIAELKPEWVRGFLDFYSLFDKDTLEPLAEFNNSENIARFIDLKKRGYKTVLSIKWNYKAPHNPSVMPSTPEALKKHQKALISLYEKVWPYVDIMVVGNEPFIESPGKKVPSFDEHLVPFYQAMLAATIDYRHNSSHKETPLFLGAFNRMDEPRFQKASEGLLALAKSTPEVTGIDLHIHHMDSDFVEMKNSIEFATARIRPEQRFISTEFSAMRYWRSKTPLALAPEFIKKYRLPKDMKVHEYLDKVLKTRPTSGAVTREEWLDFVDTTGWYKDLQSRYLADSYKTFTASPQFLLATYSFRQAFGGKFDATRDPWILNALFVNQSVKLRPDDSYELNKYYHLDFDRLR